MLLNSARRLCLTRILSAMEKVVEIHLLGSVYFLVLFAKLVKLFDQCGRITQGSADNI